MFIFFIVYSLSFDDKICTLFIFYLQLTMYCVYVDFQNISRGLEKKWCTIYWSKFFIYMKDKYKTTKAKLFIWYVEKYQHFYEQLQWYWYEIVFREVVESDRKIKANIDTDLVLTVVEDFYEFNLQWLFLLTNDWDFDILVRFWYKKWIMHKLFVTSEEEMSFLLRKHMINDDVISLQDLSKKVFEQ